MAFNPDCIALPRVDPDFVALHRMKGRPDSVIAQMGGWCQADVKAIPRSGAAYERPEPVKPILNAEAIPEIMEIFCHVAEQAGISPYDILGHSHSSWIVEPRHEAMAVVNELNRYTLNEMSQIFRKTPNAILYGLMRHYERLQVPMRDWT